MAAPTALPASAPPPNASLSLERYLEFWQLLTKGSGRVQPLNELEKSIVKATDLRQASAYACLVFPVRPPASTLGWVDVMNTWVLGSSTSGQAPSAVTFVGIYARDPHIFLSLQYNPRRPCPLSVFPGPLSCGPLACAALPRQRPL